jgi:thiol-disulfide isomerase/thioredoxin
MNSKIKLLAGILIFIIIIGGAYFAYNQMTDVKVQENSGQKDNAPAKEQNDNGIVNNQDDSATAEKKAEEDETKEELRVEENGIFDFTVYDSEGNPVKLSSFLGKPVVLNFWTTWCPYCIEEMPSFEESNKEYGDKIQFMMIDCVDGQRETKEKGEEYIEQNGYTFPVYYDTDLEAGSVYAVYSLPTSVFIDKNGYIVDYHAGMLTSDKLQEKINKIHP